MIVGRERTLTLYYVSFGTICFSICNTVSNDITYIHILIYSNIINDGIFLLINPNHNLHDFVIFNSDVQN